jgi:hypothetical protein
MGLVRYELAITREPSGISAVPRAVGAGYFPSEEAQASEVRRYLHSGIWHASSSHNSVPEATFRMYACHPREMASHDASPDVVREVATATPVMRTYLALNSRPIASCGFSGRVVYRKWEETEADGGGEGGERTKRVYCSDYLS